MKLLKKNNKLVELGNSLEVLLTHIIKIKMLKDKITILCLVSSQNHQVQPTNLYNNNLNLNISKEKTLILIIKDQIKQSMLKDHLKL